ncbi:MAG: hypothetical protein FWC68_03070 [Oscillospiraceae bacterium]|nr:hypothetical protein [Oscillospiraceae bacterium]
MFKYIKWELKDFYKRHYKIGLAILILFALIAVVPFNTYEESGLFALLMFPFVITLMFLFFATFVYGTKRVIDTFKRPTFLLESMIAYSASKILLAKYILAFIINMICVLLVFAGFLVILFRVTDYVDILPALSDMLREMNFGALIQFVIQLLVTSLEFTSIVVMVYIFTKCYFKSKKGSVIIGVVGWWVFNYFTTRFLWPGLNVNMFEMYSDSGTFFLYNFITLGFVAMFYWASVKMIENKLEVY